jgi:hypothetical protein
MSKLMAGFIIGTICTLSFNCFAADQTREVTWKGELYGIMPSHPEVTVEYCKSHAFDTYQTTADMVDKEITADNGVKAKDLGFTTKKVGGIYFRQGTAIFSGIINGKPWEETVHYFSQSLMEKDGMQQGAWYTKDCKGFYKVGPV